MRNRRSFSIPGLRAPPLGEENNAEFRLVTPDYFRTLGIRLLKGRFFNAGDRVGSSGVVMVSESVAKRCWPNEDPVGKRLVVADGIKPESREIVGVVSDTLSSGWPARFSSKSIGLCTRPTGHFSSSWFILRRILSLWRVRFKRLFGPSIPRSPFEAVRPWNSWRKTLWCRGASWSIC
jgi:MacB-like periplasmic core domain